ncbi:MAG: CapA family protein [Clostridiales bacterium]|nr:CapA family protein [Clostridiales bacterium]
MNTRRKQGEIKVAAGVLVALLVLLAGAVFFLVQTNASLLDPRPAGIPVATHEAVSNDATPLSANATLLISGNASIADSGNGVLSGNIDAADLDAVQAEAIPDVELPVDPEEAKTRISVDPMDLIGFGRAFASSNTEFWYRQMNAAAGRARVLSALAYEPRYQELCQQYGIEHQIDYIDLIAVGDNLYHLNITNSGLQSDGTYNYDSIYENVKDYISDADIKIINQEVVLTANPALWSNFPIFAAPIECGEAVVRAGFNVVTHATNHSWDKGRDVALEDIAFWKSQDGVILSGMYDSQEDYDNIDIGEYNGVKVAFLNYTYNLNGFSLPGDCQYMVKLLREDLVVSDIQKARELADIVIVFPHWGEEYITTPNGYQKNMAQIMADAGADLIIGCHPHVIQPLEILTSEDGREVPCFYSLGNFVSNMPWTETYVEALAKVRIKKDGDKVSIVYAEAVPLVNYRGADLDYTVYLLDDYTSELASNQRCWELSPSYVDNFFNSVFKTRAYTIVNE